MASSRDPDVKRKIVWGHHEDWSTENGAGAAPPALNVQDVLCRLDLLGTYDLKGDTMVLHAKNQTRPETSAATKPSGVPFAWVPQAPPKRSSINLYRGEDTRVTAARQKCDCEVIPVVRR